MTQGYNKEMYLYGRDITNHYHCQDCPCNLPLDHKKHDSLQKIMSFAYHVKSIGEVIPFANCQMVFRNILDKNSHDNPQPRHRHIHSKFMILQLHSFHAFQNKYHSVPQHDQANRLLSGKKILNLKNKQKHPFENPHLPLRYSILHCILLVFLKDGIDCITALLANHPFQGNLYIHLQYQISVCDLQHV